MKYYLDGYNLLFSENGKKERGKNLEHARHKLISELNLSAEILQLSIIVVFDGDSDLIFSCNHFRAIEIIYTSSNLSADAFLVNLIEEQSNPKLYTIVSNDKSLQRLCRLQGARTQSTKEFLQYITHRMRKVRQMSTDGHSALPAQYRADVLYYHAIFQQRLHKKTKSEKDVRPEICCENLKGQKLSCEEQRWLHLFQNRAREENREDFF